MALAAVACTLALVVASPSHASLGGEIGTLLLERAPLEIEIVCSFMCILLSCVMNPFGFLDPVLQQPVTVR